MSRAAKAGPTTHGVLVVDKAAGRTSHDLVSLARRAFATRAVGHAGTLDPMATGVLVLCIGEATKLVPWLTSQDKAYEATVALGVETDSLDADGAVVAERPVPPFDRAALERVAQTWIGEVSQVPPVISAIKVRGEPVHRRVRRGETVELPPRAVTIAQIDLIAISLNSFSFKVRCGKGVYVRSLARDLAAGLGTVGHLTALRRLASGRFDVAAAVHEDVLARGARGDEEARAALRAALLSLSDACAGMRRVMLDDVGATHARHGRLIGAEHASDATGQRVHDVHDATPVALFDGRGELIAVAETTETGWRVVRGFSATLTSC